jgi:hypothetical protein
MGRVSWYRGNKKSTVEESLAVEIRDFLGKIHPCSSGTLVWTWTDGNKSSAGYFVAWEGGGWTATLHYRWRDIEDVWIPIRMQTTPTQFRGERWWFTCPLIVDGVPCNRRAGKLYLPPGRAVFRLPKMPQPDLSKPTRGEHVWARETGAP